MKLEIEDVFGEEDFKQEICNNCHHKQLSCEENYEGCYEVYKGDKK